MSQNADRGPIQDAPDEEIVRAATRVLLRHYHPDWRPSGNALDDWGHGYITGHRQGYADGSAQ